jgi:asparagine synthase (glutamine-hydrolysing)
MALAPLLLLESHLDQGHRLSGLGGEVARGFYYAGQPSGGVTTARLVERLARWRIFTNESVDPAALEPSFAAYADATTLSTLESVFAAGDWLRATDSFYLYHRMHRWSGAHGTVAAVRRAAVNPMFDRRFIELAMAVAPSDKRDSLLLGRLMTRLDPELAAIPLDSGLIPSRLGTRSIRTRVAVASLTARKAAGKVRQRVTRVRRPQLGTLAVHARCERCPLQSARAEPGVAERDALRQARTVADDGCVPYESPRCGSPAPLTHSDGRRREPRPAMRASPRLLPAIVCRSRTAYQR